MKKVVIIGGGIAGLSAGIFAQRNGFESIILEKNNIVGGECTGWDRQGYHIDGCIHWLVGTKQGSPMNRLWNNVGALEGVEIYNPETFLSFEYGGQILHFYRDLEKFKQSWIEISPEDSERIEELYSSIKILQSYEMQTGKPRDLMGILDIIKMLKSIKHIAPVYKKYSKTELKQYANTFSHPLIREALSSLQPEGYSALFFMFALATFTDGEASLPYGGSKAFSLRMQAKYIELGGKVEKGCEALDFVIKDKKVNSVVCKNGKVFEADYFIGALDAKFFFEKLLKGEYNDKEFEKRFKDDKVYPLASEILIALGCTEKIDGIPDSLSIEIEPFKINNTNIKRVLIKNYNYESSFAPDGHSVFTCSINQFKDDIDMWFNLYNDKKSYTHEKQRIADYIKSSIEKRFPDVNGKLKVIDTATPVTFHRYCNAYRGAFMSFFPTIGGKMMEHSGKVKGLKNVFLSGQWLNPPGGLPVAVLTGNQTIQRICKKEKIAFKESP